MRGYLKNEESVFQLSPKVTTVGSDGCDLIIQSSDVDGQHAVIEYSDMDGYFILQDLNTPNGTYVNDCRVQNAAVRLAAGDIVRFGYTGPSYKFFTDMQPQFPQATYRLPSQSTTTSSQPPLVPTSCDVNTNPSAYYNSGLPQLRQSFGPKQAWPNSSSPHNTQSSPAPVPHPPPVSLRSRPLSAGTRRPTLERFNQPGGRATGNGSGYITVADPSQARTLKAEVLLPNDLKNRLSCLSEEIKRLLVSDVEFAHKDDVIASLRDEVASLQSQLRLADPGLGRDLSPHVRGRDFSPGDIHETVLPLDPSLFRPSRQPSARMQTSRLPMDDGSASYMTPSYAQTSAASNVPRTTFTQPPVSGNITGCDGVGPWAEMERLRREKLLLESMVTNKTADMEKLQKDLLARDEHIGKLCSDCEALKKDIAMKDSLVGSLSASVEQLKKEITERDSHVSTCKEKQHANRIKTLENELEIKDREIILFNHKCQTSEGRIQELNEKANQLRDELARVKQSVLSNQEMNRKLAAEHETTKQLEKSEREARVGMEQLASRLEKLRSRVIQVTFSGQESQPVDSQISDDGLISTLRIYLFERIDLLKKVKDLEAQLTDNQRVFSSSKKFKQRLNEIITKLESVDNPPPSSAELKSEIDALSSLKFAGNEVSCDLHGIAARLLLLQLSWQQNIESCLQQCGIDVGPDCNCVSAIQHHVQTVSSSLHSAKQTVAEWDLRFQAAAVQHNITLDAALNDLRQHLEDAHRAELEKSLLEAEARHSSSFGEATAAKQLVLDRLVTCHRDEIAELQEKLEELNSKLAERDSAAAVMNDETERLRQEILAQKQFQEELSQKLEHCETTHRAAVDRLQAELTTTRNKHSTDVSERDEKLNRHSATICALEEQLNKSMNKNKEYQTEISTLKKKITELNQRLLQPPEPTKPKMIIQKPVVDVAALEKKIAELERQNADHVQQIQQQSDVIAALKRDLAGSMARLSDITGELNETQKRELESCRVKLSQQDADLTRLHHQVASLSQLVEEQKLEMRSLKAEATKSDEQLTRSEQKLGKMAARVSELEMEMEEANSKKHDCAATEEENIKTELASLGAKCKGDRHDQVIARQREALMELRLKIRALEKKHSAANTTVDEALQQVLLLQAQYGVLEESEMAAQTAADGSELTTADRAVNVARGLRSRTDIDAQLAVLRDAQFALDLSESTYLALLHGMATNLSVEEVPGQRSMTTTPTADRDKLVGDRATACKLLVGCIKALKDEIKTKDDALKAFEQDIANLTDAQKFAEQSSMKAENLNMDMRKLAEEVDCLREALAKTRESLEREKRLNTAIKQRKTFHLENELLHKNGFPRHQCIPEDPFDKAQLKKKAQKERSARIRRLDSSGRELKPGDPTETQLQHITTTTVTAADGC